MSKVNVRFSERIVAVFLAALMVVSMLPIGAFATETAGSSLSMTIGEGPITVGTTQEFTVTTNVSDEDAGKMVIGRFEFSDMEAIETLAYLESQNGQWYNLPGTEFGPASGFPLTDGATSTFRVSFNTAGTYNLTVSIVEVGTGTTVCSTQVEVVVEDGHVPSQLTTDIGEKEFIVGERMEFTFATVANDDAGKMVIGTSNFSNPNAIEKLEYYEVSDGNWYELTGDFGPATGFPMSNATSTFRVTFAEAGSYTFTASMQSVEDQSVLCSTEVSFEVKDKFNVTAAPTTNGTVLVNEAIIPTEGLSVVQDTEITVSVTPNAGYQIASVVIGGEKQTIADPATFSTKLTVQDDVYIEATFIKLYTVTVTYTPENGAVVTDPASSTGSVTVTEGETVTITATPDENYRVSQVTVASDEPLTFDGNQYTNTNPYVLVLSATQDYSIEIVFAPMLRKINITATENGTVTVKDNITQVPHGADATLIIEPAANYMIDTVTVIDTVTGNEENAYGKVEETDNDAQMQLVLSAVTKDLEVAVTFKSIDAAPADAVSWNSNDAWRVDNQLYVFAKHDTVTFSTNYDGIRLTDNTSQVYGAKNEKTVEIEENITITKVEVRYGFAWHEVTDVAPTIVFDDVAPQIELALGSAVNEYGYYIKDIPFSITATDVGNYSGIAEISYQVFVGDEERTKEVVYSSDEAGTDIQQTVETGELSLAAANYNSDAVKLVVTATDRAGNTFSVTQELKICTEPPTIAVASEDEQDSNADTNSNWYNDERKITITITDLGYAFDKQAATDGIQVTRTGDGISDPDSGYVIGEWKSNGNTHTVTIAFTEDGEYEWSIEYKNKAGLDANAPAADESASKLFSFGIDTEAPDGQLAASAVDASEEQGALRTWTELWEYLTFGLFTNEEVRFQVSEHSADVYAISYFVSDTAEPLKQSELEAADFISETEYINAPADTQTDSQFAVYARLVDHAGNVTFIGTNGVIYDNTSSEIELSVADALAGNKIYGVNDVQDVSLKEEVLEDVIPVEVIVRDRNEEQGLPSSGIQKISYTVTMGSDPEKGMTQSGSLMDPKVPEGGNYEPDELIASWKGTIYIDAAANNGKNIEVAVTVVDNAGNENVEKITLAEINLDPIEATVTIDGEPVTTDQKEGGEDTASELYGWYDAPRTATITITDRASCFNAIDPAELISFEIKDASGAEITPQADAVSFGAWTSEGDTHSVTVTFNQDGCYTWSLNEYTNKAGNTLDTTITEEGKSTWSFTVDTMDPQGKISTDDNIWTKLMEVLTFGLYSKETLEVRIEGSDTDNISPVKTYYYIYTGTKALSKDELESLYNNSEEFQLAEEPSLTMEMKPDQQFTMYACIVDYAGQKTFVSSDGHIVDGTEASLEVTDTYRPTSGIYSESYVAEHLEDYQIPVVINATEADNEEDVYSGIQKVSYNILQWDPETTSYVNVYEEDIRLYEVTYERAPVDSNEGHSYTIKQYDANGNESTEVYTGPYPTKEMLCREWNGMIYVDAQAYSNETIQVVVAVTDMAGMTTTQTLNLDIDLVAPTIEVSFDNNRALNDTYFNATRTATVVFTERADHFDQTAAEEYIRENLKATNLAGEPIENAYNMTWSSTDGAASSNDDDTFTATIAFQADANYTWDVACTDAAGNSNAGVDVGGSVAPFAFTIDTQDPTGSVKVNENIWNTYFENLTFQLFSNDSAIVSVAANDATSPVMVEYFKSNADLGLQEVDIDELEMIEASGYANGWSKNILEIHETEQFNVYVRITDKAGHSILMNSDGYIVDKDESPLTITPVTLPNAYGVYGLNEVEDDGGIQLHIDANDTLDGSTTTYSGINSVTYSVSAVLNGETVQTVEETPLYQFDAEDPTKADLETNFSTDIIIDAFENDSSDVTVTVTVTDNAGNVTTETYDLDINVTTPTISVSYDNNIALNESYFNAPREATIVVTERSNHFSASAATEGIVITAKDAAGNDVENAYTISAWTTAAHGTNPNLTTHTATVTFAEDANYTFAISYAGSAGNINAEVDTGESVCPYAFTVDTTEPEAQIEINGHIWDRILNILTFGLYSNVRADVEVTATDATSPYTVTYYKTNDPIVKNTNELDTLYAEGSFVPYESFAIQTNEQFVVYVRIVDHAGNYKYISSDGYIVDVAGPALTVTPEAPNANQIYNHDVTIQVGTEDSEPYSGIAKVEYWVVADGEETQRQTLFSFDYTREEGENTNNGSLTITDWANGTENITNLTGNVPTQEQLYRTWNGSFVVDAALNNSSNVYVYVGVTDNAGNYTQSNCLLDIDITAPTIQVSYDSTANEGAVDGYYTARTATVSIVERSNHFDAVAASGGIEITAVDINGNPVDNAYVVSAWATAEGETPDAAVHTATITYVSDANYTFAIAYTDKADNPHSTVTVDEAQNPYQFTVDKTAPTGTVTATSAEGRTETWSSLVDRLTFGFWSNSQITVNGTSEDATSPIMSVVYYMPVSELASDNTTALTAEELDAVTDWQDFSTIDVTDNTQFTVYLKITDQAGNYTYIATNGLIVDEEHPIVESVAPEISVSPVAPVNGIYSGDVQVAIEVIDPMVGGTYSGLKEIRYAVFDRDSATPDVPTQEDTLFTFDMVDPDQSQLQQQWTGEIVVSSALNNSNHIQIVVYAQDNSLNAVDNSQQGSNSYTVIQVDTTAPVIDISYDNNQVDSGSYFNADRTATITVTERNFDPEDVQITITNTDGSIPVLSSWSHTTGTLNQDDSTHTATITYSADGDYTFGIGYTDEAGNVCSTINYAENTAAPTAFTIDQTAPTVQVSYDNNAAQNGVYFAADRTATVTVIEHNFNADRVTFTQTASLGGANIAIPSASWVSHNGDEHTAMIPYTADGDYTFDVAVADLAGNTSPAADYGNSVAAREFTVDKSIVEPTISGIENGMAYNDVVIPAISFSDVNFASYEIQLLRTRYGNLNEDVTAQFIQGASSDGSGLSGSFDTFESIAENDGIYTLMLSVLDLAGNTSTNTMTFTVNRFGSVYVYDDYLISLIEDGGQYITIQNGADAAITQDLTITEYNATRIAADSLMIMITRNGEPIDVNYVSEPVAAPDVSIGESGWYQYLYTISKDNFTEDGVYQIIISSRDSNDQSSSSVPENSMDSNWQPVSDTMTFTVDTTKAEIRNMTISPEARFHEGYAEINATSATVNYSIVDVGGLKSVEVFVNNESLGIITDFGGSVNSYDGTFTLNEANDRQTVRIVVEDLAGNVTDTSSEDFNPGEAYEFRTDLLVSTNAFVRWFEDKSLFYGTIGGAVGAVVVVGFLIFLVKRKKKKDSDSK